MVWKVAGVVLIRCAPRRYSQWKPPPKTKAAPEKQEPLVVSL
jgi:hypothetical protein